jgi:hypothetical protein
VGTNWGVVSTGDQAQISVFFGGGFERLADAYLYPGALRREMDPLFTGRRNLIGRIDEFLASHDRGWIVVDGPAGVGKTALLAHLAFSRGGAHHFVRRNDEQTRQQHRALRSLAAQIIPACGLAPGGVLPKAAGRKDWFDRLLGTASDRRPSSIDLRQLADSAAADGGVAGRAISVPRLVLVVDGLERGRWGPDFFVGTVGEPTRRCLCGRLSPNRGRQPVNQPSARLSLTLEQDSQENRDDMRQRLETLATEPILQTSCARRDAARIGWSTRCRMSAEEYVSTFDM